MTKLIAKNPQKVKLKTSGYSPSGGSDFEITLINSQTVPESVSWENSIPTTYSGRTGKIPEVALWQTEDEAFWYLTSVENNLYFWKKMPNSADILRILASIPTNLSQLDNDIGYITIDDVLAEGFAYKNELDEAVQLLREELPFIIDAFWESGGNIVDGPPVHEIMEQCYNDVKKTLVRPIHIYVRNISDSIISDVFLDIFQTLPNNKVFISAHTIDSINQKVNVYSKILNIAEDYFALDFSYALLADKMDLAPFNPTAEEIAVMSDGQLYSDTANHKGVVKGGQEFYDTNYIDEYYRRVFVSEYLPPHFVIDGDLGLKIGDIWVYNPPHTTDDRVYRRAYILNHIERTGIYGVNRNYTWEPTKYHYRQEPSLPDQEERVGQYYTIGETTCFCYANTKFSINDKLRIYSNGVEKTYIVTEVQQTQTGNYRYLFNQFLTPDSLPIYDGTVI